MEAQQKSRIWFKSMDPRAERSSVAQRLACSAHNRKDGGSKPPAAKGLVFLRNKPRRIYGVMEAQQKAGYGSNPYGSKGGKKKPRWRSG